MAFMKFNEHFFDRIGYKQSYFLGVLYSDGCVCKTTHGRYVLNLTMKDKDVLINFKKSLKSDNKITPLSKGRYSIALCSKHLFCKLNSLGCVQRKSYIIEKPNIPEKYFYPFLMGVYDGDGSLSCNRSINSWKASIGSASQKFLGWIINIIDGEGLKYSYEKRKTKQGKDFFNVVLTGLTAKVFLNIIYSSVLGRVIPMKRKLELFEKFKKIKFKYGPKPFPWEFEYLRQEKDPFLCSELIKNDKRNYGWVRSPQTIIEIKRYHKMGV